MFHHVYDELVNGYLEDLREEIARIKAGFPELDWEYADDEAQRMSLVIRSCDPGAPIGRAVRSVQLISSVDNS